ncbi:carbohydrate-binding protein [Paraglaciecola sp.]|uniref:carbohydrate-binding protein n=1 Tax=Paraglaciecola sp. TaxID=1920173 RepID=UPI0030F38FCB
MKENKLLLALSLAVASMTGCGGGDADKNVVRNLFAIGETVEALEDGKPVEGDVSKNDQPDKGKGLTYALKDSGTTGNGTLVFNADGTFTYTPNANFSGKDPYTYIVTQPSTGETDTAVLTMMVLSDFETPAEAGWVSVLYDDFSASNTLDSANWLGVNATIADSKLVISAAQGTSSSVTAIKALPKGRFEASILLPEGKNVQAAFAAMPMADLYAGDNRFTALELKDGDMQAAAHYGLGLKNGVSYNDESVSSATSEFHTYAVEWNDDFIRWYFDGTHIHTVNRLNVWAYNLVNDEVVADVFSVGKTTAPFNQDMQLVLKLENSGADTASMLVDYVNVFTCDPKVAPEIKNCAAKLKRPIEKLASDKIPTIAKVNTDIFIDGVFDKDDVKVSDLEALKWHYTETLVELAIKKFNSPIIELLTLADEHAQVIDVSNAQGDGNIEISAPGLEFIGHKAVLSFDMYIDSANTLTETLDIRMETGWPYMGIFTWNVADLEPDKWVTYNIPVSDFVNSPFLAPGWLNWLPGIGEGDPLPLDTSNVNSLLTIEFHGAAHLQLDNIKLTCIAPESCIQGPLAIQEASGNAAPSTTYQAENYDAQSGLQLEDTADEGGGQNIGFADPGDFLEYTITAPSDGTYYIDYRLASESGSEGFELSIDGTVVDKVTVAPTGGWQEWATQAGAEFVMTAGQHKARFDFVGGAVNINWFKVYEPVFEILVEAENYVTQSGIELEDTTDEGGGKNIGFADPGDFLEYTVNIPADGTYKIHYRMASGNGSEGFTLSFDGTVVDTVTLEATGGWQEWVTQVSEVNLVQGEQIMRIDFIGKEINMNWIKITN